MTPVVTDLESREAIEQFNDAVERMDVEALQAAITEDCIVESPAPPDGKRYAGDAMAKVFARFYALEGEVPFEEDIHRRGPRRRAVGSPLGPTQRRAGHLRGIDVFRFRHGKVAEKLSYVKG